MISCRHVTCHQCACEDCERLRARAEKAEAEVERLRAALQDLHDEAECAIGVDEHGDAFQPPDPYARWLREACERARAALQPAPAGETKEEP